MKALHIRRILLGGAAVLPLLVSPVVAQDGRPLRSIDEIIVSAEKRDVNLQKVPSSVSVFTSEALDSQSVINAVDLSGLAPGLTISKNEGFRRVVVIRGLGLEANQNDIANPSVSSHIDGVFTPSDISLNSDFLDIERIEILRGPQGTVFGQNSTGGAINVVTKQPKLDEFEGQADVSLGTFDLVRVRAAVNVPINSQFAARAAFSYFKHDGFTKNLAIPGVRLDEEDNFSGRIQLLWQPSPQFSATLRAQFFTTDVNDRAQKNILDPTPDPRKLRQDFPGGFEFDSKIYSAELKYEMPWATIKSITSYQDEEENQSRDTDRSDGFFAPADIVPDRGRTIETITQEINIVSAGEQILPVDWIVGFFYLDTETNVRFLEFADFNFDGVIDTTIDTVDPFSNPDLGFQTSSTPTRKSWSVYAQATWNVTDYLRLTGGVRYTDDEVKSQVTNFFGAFGSTPLRADTTKTTGKVSVEWDIAEDNMIYASWTRGFKPGGTNLTSGAFVPPTYGDETIDAYEVGLKNRFMDDRVQINLAAFFYDYENFQFQNTDPLPFSGGVDNIPKSEVYGVEGELTAFLTDNLRLDANFAYLKTEVTSSFLVLDSVAGNNAQNVLLGMGFDLFSPEVFAARSAAITDIKGADLPKTPEFATNINLYYDIDVQSIGVMTAHVQYTYRDSFNYRVFDNAATDQVGSYDLWNFDLRWQPENQDWTLDFIVTNIEDDNAVNSRFTDVFGVGSTSDELVAPRQFIIRAGFRF